MEHYVGIAFHDLRPIAEELMHASEMLYYVVGVKVGGDGMIGGSIYLPITESTTPQEAKEAIYRHAESLGVELSRWAIVYQ